MAIEKTYFTDYDLTKIYAWFTANATGYFDSIDISEDKLKITCYVGELDAFTITSTAETAGTLKFTFKAENGYSVTVTSAGDTTVSYSYIRRLTKTNCGIAIALRAYVRPFTGYDGLWGNGADGIFITKDNSGNTAFVWGTYLTTGKSYINWNGNSNYKSYDTFRCMNIKSAGYTSVAYTTTENVCGFQDMDYVQLVPIAIHDQNACRLPNCCFSYYSNVLGKECQVVQGDTKYVYNGYIALKD